MSLSKQELREQLRADRARISNEDQELAAINLANCAQSLELFKGALNIAVYWPHDNEISPLLLMHKALEQDKKCHLPVLIVEQKQKLAFASYTSNMPVIKNRYDILEPELNFATIIPLIELDIVFTPLVGFDKKGHRLGRGGGFYDTTFAALKNVPAESRPKIIGLAYDCQQAKEIPVEEWDWQLDAVITQSQVFNFN